MFVCLKLSPSCFTIIGLPFYKVRATLELIWVFSISPHELSSMLGLIFTVLHSCGIDGKKTLIQSSIRKDFQWKYKCPMITAAPCHLFCKWNTIYDLQFTFNCHGLLYPTRTAPVVTGLSWRYLSFSWGFWQWGGRLVHCLDVLIKRWSLKYLEVISASTMQSKYENSPHSSTVSGWVFKRGDRYI